MLVRDFKVSEGLRYTSDFLDLLPDKCLDERCQSPTEMTEILTSLRCSNPRCPTKIAQRVIAIMSMIGVKDFGPSRANSFVSKFGVKNPLAVFGYVPSDDGAIGEGVNIDISTRIYDQIQSKKSFTLWEYVRVANLPFIQTSALHLFGDFDSIEDAYAKLEAGGIGYIKNKLNIKKSTPVKQQFADIDVEPEDISIRALKIYESLVAFKSDLFWGIQFVDIIPTHKEGMVTLRAVCSDQVGTPFKTKADFYATVNNLYADLHVEFLSSVTKSIDYLVWAGASESDARVTNKVMKVRSYNETYKERTASGKATQEEHEIPIISASMFLGILQDITKRKGG